MAEVDGERGEPIADHDSLLRPSGEPAYGEAVAQLVQADAWGADRQLAPIHVHLMLLRYTLPVEFSQSLRMGRMARIHRHFSHHGGPCVTTDTVPQTVLFPDLFDKPLFAKFN